MTSQDPNFPEDIPPVPPAREPDSAEPGSDATTLPEAFNRAPTPEAEPPSMGKPPADHRAPDAPPLLPEDAAVDSPAAAKDDGPAISDALPAPAYSSRRQAADADPGNSRSRPPAAGVWADTDIPYRPKKLGVVDQLLLLLSEGVGLWKQGLRWVRSQLSPNLQRQLSDEILTAIALGLLMLLLALWNPLGAGRSEELVTATPAPEMTSSAPSLEADSSASTQIAPAIADSPAAPEIVAEEEPTPEQSLIADIQEQVSRISRTYEAGLVQSVEVDLPSNTLGVNLGEVWYGLLADQQDKVAQAIYVQTQGLSLDTLQLRDPEGVVVARDPVVGSSMIILRRLRWP
ncbi:hypothetical protein IQ254_25120 [Nodosilinea sp. LEGE 07088]|uniref:hypothetical protein n=1 Tax=Nodosilinea sp. LEGE 07088 TaxID=2777968 RepID=UPI0018820BB3|nr:hypothetical protein [Nodosilinea sp. LEGE 07088]MBE9140442.1 hypothetical protein [Nodosilinea sp. LEGE 07088]